MHKGSCKVGPMKPADNHLEFLRFEEKQIDSNYAQLAAEALGI